MPPKRLNRKKLIEQLEISRQGFSSAIMIVLKHEDTFSAKSLQAHHNMLNDLIVELGGESYPETYLDHYVIEKFKYAAK